MDELNDAKGKLAALDAAIARGLADKAARRTVPIEDVRAEQLAALDTAIDRAIADSEAGKGKPAEEVFDRLDRKYRDMGRARLRELYDQIAAARRDTPPSADEADAWSMAIDQDTGRPSWTPKALVDAFWSLRTALRDLDDEGHNHKGEQSV